MDTILMIIPMTTPNRHTAIKVTHEDLKGSDGQYGYWIRIHRQGETRRNTHPTDIIGEIIDSGLRRKVVAGAPYLSYCTKFGNERKILQNDYRLLVNRDEAVCNRE